MTPPGGVGVLESVMGPADVSVDQVNGSLVGSRFSRVPLISLTGEADRWSPCVRVKPKKKKERRRALGP